MVTDRSRRLLDLHAAYQAQHLPLAGGMLDQPHFYWQAIRLIDQLIAENTE